MSTRLRDIVVIGASAGGVSALQRLAALLPADLPAAVLVVLHIGARPSLLPELMSFRGPLPAAHAIDGEALRPGRIYIAPPDWHLLLAGRSIRLARSPKEHHTRPAIDPLFRSAALEHGAAVVGIVLTGRMDDGTAGLQAIKACGGVAVVQDPAEAEEPDMPASALRHVEIDHCVPLDGMPALLRGLLGPAAPPAAPGGAPPPWLRYEHAVSLSETDAIADLQTIGTPSTFVCPDCKGTLWEIAGEHPPRFRCHTGHGFSLRSLETVQARKTEEALWSAVRALQEKEQLLRRLADWERSLGDPGEAGAREQAAQQLARQARLLRELLRELPGS